MIDEAQLVPYETSPLPVSAGPWLVFAPHPDDETFGMGGSIAKAGDAGIAVHVCIVTDGALGGSADNLVAVREKEVRDACELLGVQQLHFLRQPDRGVRVTEALVEQVAALILQVAPAAVFFPGVMEFHPDHRACALLVWQALQRLPAPPLPVAYEIATQSPANCLVDITAVLQRKQLAMGIYLSQLSERNYERVVLALNTLRSLTLPEAVSAAEGFYRFDPAALHDSLHTWLERRHARLLEP
jgi:LmbE family N-acetylglucosaminyl deacetylase